MLVASVLVIVTVAAAFEPGATVPKSTDVGEMNKPAVAVPVSGTKIDPASVLVMASNASLAPLEAGWNVTATVAVAPGAIDMVDGAPTENDVAPAPVMANGAVSVTAFRDRKSTRLNSSH